MGKRRRKAKKGEVDASQKPWCFYCDRSFADEKILIQHQKHKHFKCEVCGRKLGCAKGLQTHGFSVHKQTIKSVPNSLEERNTFDYDIYGMIGVPEGYLQARRIKAAAEEEDAEQETKRQKVDYTLSELPQDLIPPFVYGGYMSSYPMPAQQQAPYAYSYARYAPIMGLSPHPSVLGALPHPAMSGLPSVVPVPTGIQGVASVQGVTPVPTGVQSVAVVPSAVTSTVQSGVPVPLPNNVGAPVPVSNNMSVPNNVSAPVPLPNNIPSAQSVDAHHPIQIALQDPGVTAVESTALETPITQQPLQTATSPQPQVDLDTGIDLNQTDGETELVYSDEQVSMEEKRAITNKVPISSEEPLAQ